MKNRVVRTTPPAKPVKRTSLPYREWAAWVNGAADRPAQFRADLASALASRRAGRSLNAAESAAIAQHEGRY